MTPRERLKELFRQRALQFGDFQPCAAGFSTPFNLISGTGGGVGACLEDTLDQKSYVFEGSFGYMWDSSDFDQKVWGGLTLASGDDDPNDMDQESYVPLYTDMHNRLGYASHQEPGQPSASVRAHYDQLDILLCCQPHDFHSGIAHHQPMLVGHALVLWNDLMQHSLHFRIRGRRRRHVHSFAQISKLRVVDVQNQEG